MLRTRIRAGPVAGLVMSLVFAAMLTAVRVGDRSVRAWAPELGQPTPLTLRVPYGARVSGHAGLTRAEPRPEYSRVVVPRGTLLDRKNEAHVSAHVYENLQRPPGYPRLFGLGAIYFTLAMALTTYLRKFGQSRLRLLRTQIGLLLGIALLAVVAKAVLVLTSLPEFWIPVAVVPLWVATSFDRRTALVVTVVLSFIVASLLEFDLVLLSVVLARGMAATLLYFNRKRARHLLVSGGLAGLCAAVLYVAIITTFEGTFQIMTDVSHGLGSALIACVGGGLVAGLVAAILRAPAERLLGHVSRERLLDLADLEQPLLQKLSREAPGTYEHSRAMANLAEQAASSIGVDALLTRVGAYYHDLGKTAQCKYFVENLGPDEESPHDELEPDVSADAIMAHVVIGTRILREGGIPEPIVEFAYTHHGTQMVEYFWNKCQSQGNPKNLDVSYFRYPGMKPQTKETAILMLVDSIEAASRTIDPPDREQFDQMIQRIIFTKLKQGQLDDCGLDLNELRIISNRVAETLVNMHHHRIKYQWQAKRAEEFGVPSQVVRDSAPDIELLGMTSLIPGKSSMIPPSEPMPETSSSFMIDRALPPVEPVDRIADGPRDADGGQVQALTQPGDDEPER